MRRAFEAALILCLLAVAGPAPAAPPDRIVVGPFRRDDNRVLTQQITGALCATYQCVPRASVLTGDRLDLDKVKAAGVKGVLSGTVTAWDGQRRVWIALRTVSTEPQRDWSFTLAGDGALSDAALQQLKRELAAEVARPSAPPRRAPLATPSPAPAPPPAAAVPPARTAGKAPKKGARAQTPATPVPPPPPVEVAPSMPAPPPAPPPPPPAPPREAAVPAAGGPAVFAAELGLGLTSRSLSYSGLTPPGTSALKTFDVNAIWTPHLRLEVYPAARSGRPVLAGLGLAAEYQRSIGLRTKDSAGGLEHPTTYDRLAAGVLWRVRPLAGRGLALVPQVSWVHQTLTVGAKDGQLVAGLPDADLTGLELRLGAELPVTPQVGVLLSAGYVIWTDAKDLVKGSPAFFPGGSAHALVGDAGVWYALPAGLSARALVTCGSTSYRLDPDPTGTYRAGGATDRMLGGRVVLRWER